MSLFLSSLALTGCGTSIGIEDALHCTEVSAEPVADRDAVLDDFGASPQALLDAVLGDFSGSQLEHENQGDRADRADGEAWLTVTDPGDPVTLILYEANVEDTSVYAEEPCSPRLDVGLSVVLVADGLPTFSATVTGVVAVDGGVSLSSTDTSAFDEPLPEPVAYDPADYELVEGRVKLWGAGDTWWANVGWEASNPSEAEPDGDHTIEPDTLLYSELERDAGTE